MAETYRFTLIGCIFLTAFFCGCARITGSEQSDSTAFDQKTFTVAVMPFHSVSEARNSGMIVADVMANQLYALGNYHIIAPEVVLTRLAEQDNETMSPAEAGSLLQAPYILAGRVTEYTYKTGVGETPAVGITARLLETSTAKVLWSATRTGIGGGNWLLEDSLSELTVDVCRELAASLNAFMTRNQSLMLEAKLPQKPGK